MYHAIRNNDTDLAIHAYESWGFENISKDLIELFDLIEVYNVGGLVVGFPLSLNGKENIRTEQVRKFVKSIELQKNIKIMLYDERFSSDVIFKELRKNHNSISKIKKKLDQQAAAYILQGFLDSSKNN